MLGEVIRRRNLVQHHLMLHAMAGRCRIVSGGEREGKQMIVELKLCQLDLWFASEENFGTRWLCRTGSKEHNILLCQRAIALGGKWDPYQGVTLNGKLLPAGLEADIYHALNLEWIEPRLRESTHVAALLANRQSAIRNPQSA
jgi:DNA polymerase/3'-5' exonuclease PolX